MEKDTDRILALVWVMLPHGNQGFIILSLEDQVLVGVRVVLVDMVMVEVMVVVVETEVDMESSGKGEGYGSHSGQGDKIVVSKFNSTGKRKHYRSQYLRWIAGDGFGQSSGGQYGVGEGNAALYGQDPLPF